MVPLDALNSGRDAKTSAQRKTFAGADVGQRWVEAGRVLPGGTDPCRAGHFPWLVVFDLYSRLYVALRTQLLPKCTTSL